MLRTDISTSYSPALGLSFASVSFIGLLATESPTFLTFGPSESIKFGPVKIDTWPKWFAVFIYSLCSQVVASCASATVSPFISNVVRDHKSTWDIKFYYSTQGVVQLYYSYAWITGVLDLFLYLSCQVQFWIPAFLVDLILQWIITRRQLLRKRRPVISYGAI
jgi:hypothetical protein